MSHSKIKIILVTLEYRELKISSWLNRNFHAQSKICKHKSSLEQNEMRAPAAQKQVSKQILI